MDRPEVESAAPVPARSRARLRLDQAMQVARRSGDVIPIAAAATDMAVGMHRIFMP